MATSHSKRPGHLDRSDPVAKVNQARRAAILIGCASGAIGAAALAAPQKANRALGLHNDPAMRAIGIADLALVPGLLIGRPRWLWVAARAGLNLTIAAYLIGSRQHGQTPRPLAAVAALIAVTTRDMRVAATLRAAENRSRHARHRIRANQERDRQLAGPGRAPDGRAD